MRDHLPSSASGKHRFTVSNVTDTLPGHQSE
jgi:hypothetical protein